MDENIVNQTADMAPAETAKKETMIQTESVHIQKAEWIQQETARRRKLEDDMFAQLMTEQRMIDELNRSIDTNMELTRERRRYNEAVKENLQAQVYAMHGISEDKLSGMKEYKNAYYKGVAFGMFLLSVVMMVLCGIFHGVTAQITLFMAFFTGIEGALLTRERDRGKVMDGLCKLLYILLFPSMLAIFVCFELGLSQYVMLLPYFSIAGAVILVLGTVSFFVYTPYREDRRKAEQAKNTLRDLEKQAEKEVKKQQKFRKKEEKKEAFKESAGEKWENFKARFHKKEVEIEAGLIETAAESECDAQVIDAEAYQKVGAFETETINGVQNEAGSSEIISSAMSKI